MIVRLQFLHEGERLEQRSVTSRSPRVVAGIRNGCTELLILPDGALTGLDRALDLENAMLNDTSASGNVVDFTPKPAPLPTIDERATATKAEIADLFDRLQSLPPDQQLAQLVPLVRQAFEQQADKAVETEQMRATIQELIDCLLSSQRAS